MVFINQPHYVAPRSDIVCYPAVIELCVLTDRENYQQLTITFVRVMAVISEKVRFISRVRLPAGQVTTDRLS